MLNFGNSIKAINSKIQINGAEILFFLFNSFVFMLYILDYYNIGDEKERINLGILFLFVNMLISLYNPLWIVLNFFIWWIMRKMNKINTSKIIPFEIKKKNIEKKKEKIQEEKK